MKINIRAIKDFVKDLQKPPVDSSVSLEKTVDQPIIDQMPVVNQELEERILSDNFQVIDKEESPDLKGFQLLESEKREELPNEVSITMNESKDNSNCVLPNPHASSCEADDTPLDEPGAGITTTEEKTDTGLVAEQAVAGDVEPGNIVSRSLLANSPFIKIVEECVDMMDEFEGYADRCESDESLMIVNLMTKRVQELLERSGLERIDNEMEFSILRHLPVPMQIVQEGTPIVQTNFPGLALGNRVYRKAKVVI